MTENEMDMFLYAGIAMFALIIISLVVIVIVQGYKNKHAPKLTVNAVITARRITNYHSNHSSDVANQALYTVATTNFYVTFKLENGKKREFMVGPTEYNRLYKGEKGKLTYQGKRFLSFEKEKSLKGNL